MGKGINMVQMPPFLTPIPRVNIHYNHMDSTSRMEGIVMIIPYLYFNGNARDAITLYVKAFHADMPEIMILGDMPPDPEHPIPDEAKNLVMHAELHIADGVVMISDSFGTSVGMDGNINMMVTLKDEEKLRSTWDTLKVGGEISMPLAPTFWSPLFGSLTDKFGVEWQFGQDQ